MTNHQFYKLITIIPFFVSFSIFAQSPRRTCATHDIIAEQMRQDPSLIDKIEEIEHHTHQYVSRPHLGTRNSVISIPVVIHVVYRIENSIENISDDQIMSQIEVLNNDYRRLNSDRTATPSVFGNVATDCGIEFKLAKRTPQGKATTGIMRYPSARRTTWGKNDDVKTPEKGGITPWDPSKYLNIYVCAIGGGVLGYSTMPGSTPLYDGVVIDYRYFGTKNTVTPFDKGRTATHEIGHWLNLRHIWGDKDCGDDNVSDTPVQFGPNYGCLSFPHKSCGNQASGDMFMNFMDYTDDACMNMFTKGQKNRIMAVFATGGARASLLNSDALIAPNESCPSPLNLTVSLITNNSAQIGWSSANNISDFVVEYREKGSNKWYPMTVKGAKSVKLINLTANTVFEGRISSLCGNNQLGISSTISFTTLSNSNDCVDIYEFNNTFSAAKEISVNTAITALIDNPYDNDYFIINQAELNKDIKVSLSNLPADFDVRLYNANNQLVGSSTKVGTEEEKIIYKNAPKGIYYIRVYPNEGNSSNQCYKLLVEVLKSGMLREEDNTVGKNSQHLSSLKVFPNPVMEVVNLELKTDYEGEAIIRILDMTNREIKSSKQNVTKDVNNIQVDATDLRDGLYVLLIQYGNQHLSQKIIIHKNM